MSYETIQSEQTDTGSPLDKQLMDQGLRLNMDALSAQIDLLGAGGFSFTLINVVDDFLGYGPSELWDESESGTGAAVAQVAADEAALADNRHIGTVTLETGTATNGVAGLYTPLSFKAGNGELVLEWLVRIEDLATSGVQDYTFRVGLSGGTADITSSYPDEGIYVQYDKSQSDNWLFNARTGGVGTATASSVPVTADTWWRIRLVFSADGTEVEFFVGSAGGDLASIGTKSSGLPTGLLRNIAITKKTAGTTNRKFYLDYAVMRKTITGGR